MTETDKIIKEEIDAILADIRKEYSKSGRKVTGNFSDGLEAIYTPNSALIRGFYYLAGRGATKNGHKSGTKYLVDNIRQWMWDKGIAQKAISENQGLSAKGKQNLVKGIAYAITKKIHEKGTDKSRWLKVYEKVITPERVDSIIDRVAELNVNLLVTQIQIEIELLSKELL